MIDQTACHCLQSPPAPDRDAVWPTRADFLAAYSLWRREWRTRADQHHEWCCKDRQAGNYSHCMEHDAEMRARCPYR